MSSNDSVREGFDIVLQYTTLVVNTGLLVYPIKDNEPQLMRTLLKPGTYSIMRGVYYEPDLQANMAWVVIGRRDGFVGIDAIDWGRIKLDEANQCYVYG